MKDKIKVGIIGLGDCALNRFVPQLAKEGSFEIAKVADVDLGLRKMFWMRAVSKNVQDYLLNPGSAEVPEEFFKGLDIAYIASPNWAHLSQTAQSLKHKDIITVTEKPLVRNQVELNRLEEIVGMLGASDRLFVNDHYVLKPTSMYAKEHLPELIKKYGKIKSIDAHILEVGNILGIPREKWLISPEAGGGLLIDTGGHVFSILTKILGADITQCDEAVALDMYPKLGFRCETGFYGRFTAKGDYFAPSKGPNVTLRVAKDYKADDKEIVLNLESAEVKLAYEPCIYDIIVKPKDSLENSIELSPNEYSNEYRRLADMLRDELTSKDKKPFLTIDDAGKSLRSIFMAYDKVGGIYNMQKITDRKAIDGLLDYNTDGGRK